MFRLSPLPRIMVAPNGARRSKADHPALPMTIAETVAAAKASFEAGAQALHAHIRDTDGAHTLDAAGYRELIKSMAETIPDMAVQITTEAVGRFSPEEQRATVLAVRPEGASVALSEMWPEDSDGTDARGFYATCAAKGITIQHICYSASDLTRLLDLVEAGDIPHPVSAIFVLGRYATGQVAHPDELRPFLAELETTAQPVDWALCAFGPQETACLVAAHKAGGKMRIGFENNLHQRDGSLAPDNAARVAELVAALGP